MIKKVFFILIYIFLTASVFAQWNNTGSLTINGNMPLITELRIEDNGVLLDLESAQTDVVIGSVFERSNSVSGYTVSVSSSNNGELVSTEDSLTYTLSYDGTNVDLSTTNTVTTNSGRTSMGGIERELSISHDGGTDGMMLYEGSYSDDLTFEIVVQ